MSKKKTSDWNTVMTKSICKIDRLLEKMRRRAQVYFCKGSDNPYKAIAGMSYDVLYMVQEIQKETTYICAMLDGGNTEELIYDYESEIERLMYKIGKEVVKEVAEKCDKEESKDE